MAAKLESYWEVVEPIWNGISIDSPEKFLKSLRRVPRPALLLYASHFCLSEVHNGGFLQFFWNSTGVLGPEAAEGFQAIGMERLAGVVSAANVLLGDPYPRDRNDRWDALLVESGHTEQELKQIFDESDNVFLSFRKATALLPFDQLDKQAWDLAAHDAGGFQQAATRYAQNYVNKAKVQ